MNRGIVPHTFLTTAVDGSQRQLYAPALRKQPLLPTEQERLGPKAYSCFREGKHLLSFFKPQLFRCPDHSLATMPMKDIHSSLWTPLCYTESTCLVCVSVFWILWPGPFI